MSLLEKTDIRHYCDEELINWVINDEYLYNIRSQRRLFDELDELFIYNADQKDQLITYLEEEE